METSGKKYSFLSKRIKNIPPKYKALKFTAIFTLIGFVIGILSNAIIPEILIEEFGFMGICSKSFKSLQSCVPIPYLFSTIICLLSGLLIGLIIDLIRKLFRN